MTTTVSRDLAPAIRELACEKNAVILARNHRPGMSRMWRISATPSAR